MIKYLVTLLLLAVGAYFVFDWVFSNHSALFFTDFGVVIIAEIIFLGNLPLLTDNSALNIKSAAGGVLMNTCAIALLSWMLIYNLFMRGDTSIEVFWAGDVIIVGYLLLKGFILTSTAEVALEEQNKLDSEIQQKKDFKFSVMEYSHDIIELLKNNATIPDKDSIIRQFRTATDKVTSLSSGILLRNESLTQDIDAALGEMCSLCSEQDWDEEKTTRMKSLIDSIVFKTKNLR